MSLLTDEHRAWIGRDEPPVTINVSRRDIQKYAAATEQQLERFVSGDEAPPMFIFNLFSPISTLSNLRSDGLPHSSTGGPRLPLKRVMAGGTEIRQHGRVDAARPVGGRHESRSGRYQQQPFAPSRQPPGDLHRDHSAQ